jgi:phosphoribosylformylglycinamidine synthase
MGINGSWHHDSSAGRRQPEGGGAGLHPVTYCFLKWLTTWAFSRFLVIAPVALVSLYNRIKFMRARVYVSLKPTVLDPQGQTIRSALNGLGYAQILDVRQGKFFDIEMDGAAAADAERQLEQIARDVLANPVIEDYRVEILE